MRGPLSAKIGSSGSCLIAAALGSVQPYLLDAVSAQNPKTVVIVVLRADRVQEIALISPTAASGG